MIREKNRAAVIGLALMLLCATPAMLPAEQKVDETREFGPEGMVSISNVSGSINVTGTDEKEVHVEGVLGDGVEDLKIEREDGRLKIEVVYPDKARNVKGSHLRVRLPKGCDVEVDVVSAQVRVAAVEGDLEVESVSGDIMVDGNPKEAELETVSGSITVRGASGPVEASSVSGDIQVREARGELDLEVVSGDIEVGGEKVKELEAQSVSGDITFQGDFAEDGSCEISVHSGDITLFLPADIEADLEAGSFSGEIESDFGSAKRREEEITSAVSLGFILGSGDVKIRLETFSGDISIRKE